MFISLWCIGHSCFQLDNEVYCEHYNHVLMSDCAPPLMNYELWRKPHRGFPGRQGFQKAGCVEKIRTVVTGRCNIKQRSVPINTQSICNFFSFGIHLDMSLSLSRFLSTLSLPLSPSHPLPSFPPHARSSHIVRFAPESSSALALLHNLHEQHTSVHKLDTISVVLVSS